ncbi:MAG TPA: hypothetical protein VMA36_05375 [Candidatus Limnocylindria bacterium]|jgi:hypothetical protein|nr:hypothetical protein [Candidatus Limnocylindria bacterium]
MDHGKFCQCSHTERSHGLDGCQVIRYVDGCGKAHLCRCKLSADQVRRNDDHLEVVLARRAERRAAAV